MDIHKIQVVLRRARLRLVRINNPITSDKTVRKKRQIPVLSNVSAEMIYYGNIGAHPQKITSDSNVLPKRPTTDKKRLCKPGTNVAPQTTPMARTPQREASKETDNVEIISNAGVLSIPDEKDVPNEYEFEILRLRRRVEELECTVHDRDERNVKAMAMLEDELQMWRTLMQDHVQETHGGIQRRIIRLESTLLTLREKGSRAYPALSIPEAWKQSDR